MHRYKYIILLIACTAVSLCGCNKFLEEKPDKKMSVPVTLADCEALLDNQSIMNSLYPVAGEVAIDDYFLSATDYNAVTDNVQKENYHWFSTVDVGLAQWRDPYRAVLFANQVMQVLKNIDRNIDPSRYDRLLGQAHFFRGYALFQVALVFALPYVKNEATQTQGVVIRITPNVDEVSVRSDLNRSLNSIATDLQEAIRLLPEKSLLVTRPSREAAMAALMRVKLYMGSFEDVVYYGKQALAIDATLIDYNSLSTTAALPFQQFNKEVLFHATTSPSVVLNPVIASVDTVLIAQYQPNDKRFGVYFTKRANGTFSFKGRYDANNNSVSFSGIARDEVYLSIAEALVRIGKVEEGIGYLNQLLITRWSVDTFVPIPLIDKDKAMDLILLERRKSLMFRNLRWMDLKRLSTEDRYAISLTRELNGQIYRLEKNDMRYAFLIPDVVIKNSSLSQNKR